MRLRNSNRYAYWVRQRFTSFMVVPQPTSRPISTRDRLRLLNIKRFVIRISGRCIGNLFTGGNAQVSLADLLGEMLLFGMSLTGAGCTDERLDENAILNLISILTISERLKVESEE
ncbi:MAG: hypothetical protein R3F36_07985 [Candidatus Competibacteraceae bacterium]